MRLLIVCLLLAPAAGLRAADAPLGDPGPVDTSPTAYACTLETLRTGARCVLEGDPGAPFAATSAQLAAQVGEVLCSSSARVPGEARPDPATKAACLAEVQRRLRACADDRAVILDAAGQFVPSARACYAALSVALAKVNTQASLVTPCCRCVADHACGGVGACLDRAPGESLPQEALSCAADACADVCAPFIPPVEEAPARPGHPRGSTGHQSSPASHDTPAVKDI